jgi:hypothetical protein
VAGFAEDPFVDARRGDRLPDIVTQAVLDLFYNDISLG